MECNIHFFSLDDVDVKVLEVACRGGFTPTPSHISKVHDISAKNTKIDDKCFPPTTRELPPSQDAGLSPPRITRVLGPGIPRF